MMNAIRRFSTLAKQPIINKLGRGSLYQVEKDTWINLEHVSAVRIKRITGWFRDHYSYTVRLRMLPQRYGGDMDRQTEFNLNFGSRSECEQWIHKYFNIENDL